MHFTNREPRPHSCDVASDFSEAAGAPAIEIEITPEMIDEGVDELKGEYFNLFPGGDLYPQIVRNVFVRMMEVSRIFSRS
jgi:hypothetical protein